MRIEEILKAAGYTDADIAAMGTMLNDPKFRTALESQVGALQTQLSKFQEENTKWATWAEQTNKPQLEKFQRENLELVSSRASLEARLKAVDPTFTPGTPGAPPERKAEGAPSGDAFDPKKHNLVTMDEVNNLARGHGDALAVASDLRAEYHRLTGQDMLDYTYRTQDGRELRGMQAFLHESRAANKLLPDYIAEKFDFAGKRAKLAEDAKRAQEEAIRKDERAKVMGEFGNPNARPLMPSQNPFAPHKAQDGTAKQPWEYSPADRRNARITHAMEVQAKSVN